MGKIGLMDILNYLIYTGVDEAITSFLKNNALLISGVIGLLKSWAMVSDRASDNKVRSLLTSFFVKKGKNEQPRKIRTTKK